MKLASYQINVVAVPYEEGRRAAHVILRLRTDDGVEGLGYFTMVTAAAWFAKPLVATLEAMLERVRGADPLDSEALNARLLAMGDGPMSGIIHRAAAIVDVAAWDIAGKALGQPVYRLLGGYRDRVPVYASWKLWWTYDLPTLSKHAKEMVGLGFKAMKFRLGGVLDPREIAARAATMRDAVGDGVALMADANQSWTLSQAIPLGRALDPYRLRWLEDPVHHEDHAGLAEVARAVETPVATGESYHTVAPFVSLLQHRSVADLIVDIDVGGLTQWVKVARLAEAYRTGVAGHTATEVCVHAVAAVPNGTWVEYIPWIQPLFKAGPVIENGMLVAPQTPGLGLELDEAALAKYAV